MSSFSVQADDNCNSENNINNNQSDSRGQGSDLHIVTESGDQSIVWRSNRLTYIGQDRHELPAVLATKFGPLATKLDLSYNSLTSFKNIKLFTNLNELILDNNNFEDDQLDFRLNLRLKTLSLNKNKLTNLYKLINSIKVCYPNLEYLSLIGNPLCPGSMLMNFGAAAAANDDEDNNDDDRRQFHELTNNTADRVTDYLSDPTKAMSNGGIREIDELILSENRARRSNNGHRQDSELSIEQYGNRQQWADAASMMMNKTIAKTRTGNNWPASDEFSYQKYRHFIIYHLPNLRFLDSSPISASERDDALRRCFWMNRAKAAGANVDSIGSQLAAEAIDRGGQIDCDYNQNQNQTATTAADGSQVFRLSIMTDPLLDGQQHQSKGAFSRLAYKYTGKNSEGNRFIRNHDL